jgi:hypothetical protein
MTGPVVAVVVSIVILVCVPVDAGAIALLGVPVDAGVVVAGLICCCRYLPMPLCGVMSFGFFGMNNLLLT